MRIFSAWDPPVDDIFLAKTLVCTKKFKSSSVTREAAELHEVTILVIFEDEDLKRKVLLV